MHTAPIDATFPHIVSTIQVTMLFPRLITAATRWATVSAVLMAALCLTASVSWGQSRDGQAARPPQRAASLQRLPDQQPAEYEIVDPVPHPHLETRPRQEAQPHLEIGITLGELEQMALANNPAIFAAQGRLDAAHGRWLQVGLKPNPVVGYIGDDIGADGSGGAQGAFLRREFVRGNKLQLAREVAAQQVAQAEADWQTASTRVRTDVRVQFYRTLLAQRRLEVARQLADVSEKAAAAAKRLWDVREGRRVDYLRARIEADRMQLASQEADMKHTAAWRELAMVVGLPRMTRRPLAGDMDDDLPPLEFDAAADRLLSFSPALAAAQAEVERAAWAINRAEAEAIPNVEAGVELKYDTASDDTLVVVEAGFPLPLWNRNQGGVQQACGEHAAAVARLQKLELHLRRELAIEFQKYEAARLRVLRFSKDILPNSRTAVELVEAGLAGGELDYLDLLTARRTLFQSNLDYIDALEQLWIASQRIEGLLLSGSLDTR